MPGRVHLWCFVSIFFLHLSCSKDFNPDFKDEPEQLVVFAEWDVLKGLTAHLSKTASTKNKVYVNDLKISDGEVFLKDSNTNITIKIPHKSDGTYFLKTSPILNHTYSLEVRRNDLRAYSKNIEVPHLPNDLQLKRTLTERDTTTNRLLNMQYELSFTAANTDQYYEIIEFKNQIQLGSLVPNNFFCKTNKINLINTICSQGQHLQLNFGNEYLSLLYIKGYEPHHGSYFTNVSTVSESYYKYLLSILEPEPIEKLFLHPTQTYTNIEGGFGVFYIRNGIVDTISID